MKVNIRGKILAVFLCVFIMVACTITAFGATGQKTERKGSITISFPLENAEFQLFKIGNVSGSEIELFDEFAAYRVDMESKSAADTMTVYLKRDDVAPYKTAVTNSSKKAVFNNLDRGVYLVTGDSFIEDNTHYYIKSFIVYVPYIDSDKVSWDIFAEAKYEVEEYEEGDVLSVNAMKMWRNRMIGRSYPEVRVQLLRDWEIYDTAVLNESNNWTYEWKKLDPKYTWLVIEENAPVPYMVSLDQEDDLHIITNRDDSEDPSDPTTTQPEPTETAPTIPDSSTSPTEPTEPSTSTTTSTISTVPTSDDSHPDEPTQPTTKPDDKLTQTGQLNWPIPVLCFVGAVFMIIGVAAMRRKQ